MGTTVGCLGAGGQGPAILLSGHLRGPGAILVYRVQDYAATGIRPASPLHRHNTHMRTFQRPVGVM